MNSLEILARNYDTAILTRIREIYASGRAVQKQTILMLYSRIGGWKIIADIILALMEKDKFLLQLAWTFLHKWQIRSINIYTSPSPEDLESIREAYKKVSNACLVMTYNREELWKKLPFFLR